MCPRLVLVSNFIWYPQYWKRIDAPTHLIRVIVTRPFHNLIYQSVSTLSTLLTYFKTVLFRLLLQKPRYNKSVRSAHDLNSAGIISWTCKHSYKCASYYYWSWRWTSRSTPEVLVAPKTILLLIRQLFLNGTALDNLSYPILSFCFFLFWSRCFQKEFG